MIFKDHELEMFIQSDTPKTLEKYLRNILPNDYEEFLDFYSLPRSTHTSAYFLNLCDKDRDVFNMFKLAIPKFKKEATDETN